MKSTSSITGPISRLGSHLGNALLILAAAGSIAAAGKTRPPSDGTIYGRPMLVVSSASVGPQPGKESSYPAAFDLKLTVTNIGSMTASHIVGTVPDNPYVGAQSGSTVFGITYLYARNAAETTLHMVLDSTEPNGRVQPVVHFEYYSYDEEDDVTLKYTGDEPVRLSFGEPGWNRPALLITGTVLDPDAPSPGEACTLRINFRNVSAGDARQLLVRLGGTEGPKPFAAVGMSNVAYVARLPAGGEAEATFSLAVAGDTAAGTYSIPVSLSYQNILGEAQTEDQVISLTVVNRPALQAGWVGDLPSPILAGESFELAVEVINVGRQSINVNTIELTSGDLTLTNNSLYSGPLDESTSTSLVADAVAEKAGTAEVLLTVHYLDEFNRPQTWTQTFTLTIEGSQVATAAPAPDAEDSPSFLEAIWKAILAFLGFGG
jgi:hypothetical protein